MTGEPAEWGQGDLGADWQRRVVGRSLRGAQRRSIDQGGRLVRAAAVVLERSNGQSLTVQEVADEAGQSLRTLYQYFSSKEDLLLAVFEEAVRLYVQLIRTAVEGFDDPVERLAGTLIAAARVPALHDRSGFDRGLSQLRLQLGQADPELLARAQAPVTSLLGELVEDAMAAAPERTLDTEAATFFLAAARTSFVMSSTLGNEYGVRVSDVIDLSVFCLGGLGLGRSREWHEWVDERLALSGEGRSILRRLAKGSSLARQ
ncbi:TetR/AcrR family transcriptional regulator [Frankia sp. CNm7]|uniref:TetR/AcrR family transcriptional regulator n=1 Tax=Frankia nepalensis TaxID=1836974 RepID=A0A937URV3_9ACTN|nr:TetR/AcrR family transcriptional regulator [Frankia nepalensis]MBL7498691.1 TetR/AcrR family transcriptional regulator [Frankia nepalensis]MBL7512913.1 TetR/AcrR family transcriptional regulator [Frankia nepalensis]MBL7521647.1 TetR/AcrR family transcriptional regulator [Frankia nepalensis]MBL7633224.1 TetR/AcrR family transcriptional regulator [Frankia nepalensis]